MRLMRSMIIMGFAFAVFFVDASTGNTSKQVRGENRISQPGPSPQTRGRRGRGRRPAIQTLNVSLSAWPDGGWIPLRYTQVGGEVSPGVSWAGVPPGTQSFVLIMRDLDAMNRDGSELMHWLLWNIPGSSTSIPPDLPEQFELEDGTRQISTSGPRYRGPGAMANGPIHHYVIEVFALDTTLDMEVAPRIPRGPSPADLVRDAVFEGMQGHVLGKGAYFGLFRRPQ